MGLLPVEQQPMNFVSTSTTDLPIRNVMVSNQPCLFLAEVAANLLPFSFPKSFERSSEHLSIMWVSFKLHLSVIAKMFCFSYKIQKSKTLQGHWTKLTKR